MAIQIRCECGAAYRVPDEAVGRVVRCKKCEHRILVEKQAADPEAVRRAAVLSDEISDSRADRDQMLQELERSQQESDSAASNPAMLRVSYWRHLVAFPKWPLIWHLGLAAAVGLTVLVHWSFGLLAAVFGFASVRYWQQVKAQFIAGCVNPGQILSVRPPLVAVSTDLRRADHSYPVVKVLSQPLHRMLNGPPTEGQRVASVAFYEGAEEELDRWTDFMPRLASCVTADAGACDRLMQSIEQEDWDELATGIAQLPQPYQPGLYRIYPAELQRRSFHWQPDEIAELIEAYLEDTKYCRLMSAGVMLPHETFAYVPKNSRKDVIAVIESAQTSADLSQGMCLTAIGAFYNFEDFQRGAFRWKDLLGAFVASQNLELAFTDQSRLHIPRSHFLSAMRVSLEMLFNTIGRGAE